MYKFNNKNPMFHSTKAIIKTYENKNVKSQNIT